MSEKYYPSIKNSIVLCLLFTLFSIILGGLLGLIIGIIPSSIDTEAVMSIGVMLISPIVYIILFKMILNRMEISRSELFNKNCLTPKIFLSFIVMMLGFYVLNFQIAIFVNKLLPMPQFLRDIFNNLSNDEYVFTSYMTLLVIPVVFEEMLFRGFILKGLIRNYSAKTTIIFSALLFGLIHLNPWQFVSAFLLGLIFAWMALKTKSIIYPMMGHFINNLISLLFDKVIKLPFIQVFEAENGIISPVLILIATVLFLTGLYSIKTQLQNEPLKPVIEPQVDDITA